MSEWKEVPSSGLAPFFKFKEIGDKLKGKIVARRQGTTPDGKPEDLYDIETTTGPVTLGANNKDLKDKLSQAQIPSLADIELVDKKKVKGRALPMKIYSVKLASVPGKG